jgi:amino acid transporter
MSIIPEEVFKRKHFGTPGYFMLMTTNFVVVTLAVQILAACAIITWYFWAAIAALAVYNFYKIRRDREEYDKIRIIAYIISLAGMVLLFFALRINLHC